MRARTLPIALLGVVCITTAVHSEDAVGCVTSKCHQTMGTATWVHGPVGVGECRVCHVVTNEKDHRFELRMAGEELCFACHEAKRDMMLMEHTHTPVANGQCVGCHDPHQSEYRFNLKGNAAELCFRCHDQATFSREHVHGPVDAGECNACHNPHASDHAKQLLADPPDLCFLCHDEKAGVLERRHVHAPVATGCTTCHDPHSNTAEFMLTADPPELCIGCHKEMASTGERSHQHAPVAAGQCTTCHDPHGTDNPRLSPAAPRDMCVRCHKELGEYIASQEHQHGPVKQGDCIACHDPHGSENHRILRKYFPEEFYTGYREENYAICFECHNRDIAREAKTTTLTEFRDGDRNLHFLHVNKDVKGRTCRACHQVHASNQERHIRTSVPFGDIDWELPVHFTKNENGGACQVGCHAPKEYSRK